MPDTIFSKIIKGDIPCHQVYRDDHVLAFLDIGPLSKGHTLVIPIEPAETLDALSDEAAAALGRVLPRICRAVKQTTGAQGYNVLQNNGPIAHQAVMHVHFHIIPKYDNDNINTGTGLPIHWPAGKLDTEKARSLATKLADAIKNNT